MAYIYANLILNGKKTINQVPKNLIDEVENILNTITEYDD